MKAPLLFIPFLLLLPLELTAKQPHLILLLVDDLGHHKTQITNDEALSPNLNDLINTSG